ncbi:MAG TPA: LPS export ABC transporter periplasmic protein LptC [Steroidobacteraceae bacterium]|nr:LPS export ABC transporter periplasmic protein LptC [Steroidobacteraceae bacterium]
MKAWRSWSKPLGTVAVIAVIAIAYFIGRSGRDDAGTDTTSGLPPDPGYAARDAVVVETGYDGRERYRLNAKVIHQQIDSSVIELEGLDMDYHPGAQDKVAGEATALRANDDKWHLRSDRGQVRADGDDVQLVGNVVVTGRTPGQADPITLTTESMRINTPTEFIETDAPVRLDWSGHSLDAVGMRADLKAGTLSLESDVHGEFSSK